MRDDVAEQALRVVVVQEGTGWLAQCVDFEVAGEGETVEEALADFGRDYIRHILMALHLKQPPFQGATPPDRFKEHWENLVASGVKPRPLTIPRFKVQPRESRLPKIHDVQYACAS